MQRILLTANFLSKDIIFFSGLPAIGSLQPVSGSIYFLSSDTTQSLTVTILPVNLMAGYKVL